MPRVSRSHVTAQDIRDLRDYHGLTQLDLANRLGVQQASVAHWEGGRYPVSETVSLLIELAVCNELHCTRGCVDPMRGIR